jgi:hypothetical protein
MKHPITILLTCLAALGFASRAQAQIGVSLQPTPQVINVGDPASMDLVVSGLGNLSPPSLGAFDFDLSYNPAILDAVSLTFGTFLDLGTLGSLRSSDLSVAGVIELDEISFETSADLNNAQPGAFTLATLGFNGVGPGISSIAFTFASLSDEGGLSITAFSTTDGAIEVRRQIGVPDVGSTASLLLLGIVSLLALRRSSNRDEPGRRSEISSFAVFRSNQEKL